MFCFALVLPTLPELSFAHATPIQYAPAASSVLSQAPTEVQIRFSERVEPGVSSIVVTAPDGSRADLSNFAADPTDQGTGSREERVKGNRSSARRER